MEVKRKNSKKRAAILDALASVTEHPTAEMLYNALKPMIPELSLGTVYRNLGVLVEDGLVRSVGHVNGQERYDARTEPHAHFICRKCRKVLDLELPDTVSQMYRQIDDSLGCTSEAHTLSISGLCPDCRQ